MEKGDKCPVCLDYLVNGQAIKPSDATTTSIDLALLVRKHYTNENVCRLYLPESCLEPMIKC